MTPAQRQFNYIHSSTRIVVEQAFGLLKSGFRKLLDVTKHRTDEIPKVIMACCVLHNICVTGCDELLGEHLLPPDDDNDGDGNDEEAREDQGNDIGRNRRQQLMSPLHGH